MIVYLVCFDLSRPWREQLDQLVYWLNFLNSSFSLSPLGARPSWRIFIVGLKSDVRDPSAPVMQPHHVEAWNTQYPYLPFYNEVFEVSSATSKESVGRLLSAVDQECIQIFEHHALEIPTIFSKSLDSIKQHSSIAPLVQEQELYAEHGQGIDSRVFETMLQYYHEIGQIVLLKEGLVCTYPQLVTKIAAKFISPEEVQMSLLMREDKNIQILSSKEVGCLLNIKETNNARCVSDHTITWYTPKILYHCRLKDELALMLHCGVCFELKTKLDAASMYIFPSLSSGQCMFA